MSKLVRLAAVAALGAAVVAPSIASAAPPPPPFSCKVIWTEVAPGVSVPSVVCYG